MTYEQGGLPLDGGSDRSDPIDHDGLGWEDAGGGIYPEETEVPDVDDNAGREGPGPEVSKDLPLIIRDRGEAGDRQASDPAADAALEAAVREALGDVQDLDPELLDREETRRLLEIGAAVGHLVTKRFGTPDHPLVASGTYERGVFMAYHNGGKDGHTSVGPRGAGVPRNALWLARAVNNAAGYEVYPAPARALVALAGFEHDSTQLCGRTLLAEGQGAGRGDERLAAENGRQRLLAAGVDPRIAQEEHDLIMVTAWNPLTSTQNVNYAALEATPRSPEVLQRLLNHELLAAADLLSPVSDRGPLGTFEYAVERMFLHMNDQAAQRRLHELGIDPASISSMDQMIEVIGEDRVLTEALTNILAGDPVFYADYLSYSDRLIRQACGRGVDELAPNRLPNSEKLALHVLRLREGQPPQRIWRRARHDAGY